MKIKQLLISINEISKKDLITILSRIILFNLACCLILPILHIANVANWINDINFFLLSYYWEIKLEQKNQLIFAARLILGNLLSFVIYVILLLYAGIVTGQ